MTGEYGRTKEIYLEAICVAVDGEEVILNLGLVNIKHNALTTRLTKPSRNYIEVQYCSMLQIIKSAINSCLSMIYLNIIIVLGRRYIHLIRLMPPMVECAWSCGSSKSYQQHPNNHSSMMYGSDFGFICDIHDFDCLNPVSSWCCGL
jgi:hypothetical protein